MNPKVDELLGRAEQRRSVRRGVRREEGVRYADAGTAAGPSRRYRVALNLYFVLVFVGIGGLQMYQVDAGYLTSYGADLLAPPWIYLAMRGDRGQGTRLTRALGVTSPLTRFLFVLGACFLWEWLQRYDLSGTPLAITRGHFDPYDMLAYTAGLLVTFGVETLWLRRRHSADPREGTAGAG